MDFLNNCLIQKGPFLMIYQRRIQTYPRGGVIQNDNYKTWWKEKWQERNLRYSVNKGFHQSITPIKKEGGGGRVRCHFPMDPSMYISNWRRNQKKYIVVERYHTIFRSLEKVDYPVPVFLANIVGNLLK